MIDRAEENAVEPADALEQILIDPFIGEKIHHRFEVQAERLEVARLTKSLGRARCQSGMPLDRPPPRRGSLVRRVESYGCNPCKRVGAPGRR